MLQEMGGGLKRPIRVKRPPKGALHTLGGMGVCVDKEMKGR